MLNKELVNVFDRFDNWIDAIYKCGESLVNTNMVASGYLDSIIANTKKYGPYYIVDTFVAIAHADIDDKLIRKTGVSWNLIKHPVEFGNDEKHQVKLLLILCTRTADEHQDYLRKIALFLMNKENKKNIFSISDKDNFYNYLIERLGE